MIRLHGGVNINIKKPKLDDIDRYKKFNNIIKNLIYLCIASSMYVHIKRSKKRGLGLLMFIIIL